MDCSLISSYKRSKIIGEAQCLQLPSGLKLNQRELAPGGVEVTPETPSSLVVCEFSVMI